MSSPMPDDRAELAPLIVTLALDPHSFAFFDRLRQLHFPPERNFLSAHLTLFHALPGADEALVRETLIDLAASTTPIPLRFPGVRSLGRGVAAMVEAPELIELRRALARTFESRLTPQDGAHFSPHITIQNKVEPESARLLLNELASGWETRDGLGEGLSLFRYRGGPWEPIADCRFSAPTMG